MGRRFPTGIGILVRDIGYELGIVATITELERTKLGNFSLEDTYTIDDIRSNMYSMFSIEEVLDLPKIIVDEALEKKIRNGQVLDKFFDGDMAMIMNKDNDLLAIYQIIENDKVKPYRMFI